MFYHIGQCAGICRQDFDLKDYLSRLEKVKKLLKSGPQAVCDELERQIKISDKGLNFERSKVLSMQLEQIKQLGSVLDVGFDKSGRPMLESDEKHVWIMGSEKSFLEIYSVKSVIAKRVELWMLLDDKNADPVEYLTSYYAQFPCPNSIFTNFQVSQKQDTEQFLAKWNGKPGGVAIVDTVNSLSPDFVQLCLILSKAQEQAAKELPQKIAQLIGSPKPIHTIDCFDISHHQGQAMVGACLRFASGKPDKKNYRLFKIKTVVGQDDYACLREIVSRRYKDGTQDLPDLVLIDGGKGQRNAVADLVGQANLAALAKKEEHLFCQKNLDSWIALDQNKPHQAILLTIRDYTHNFAIAFHRKSTKLQ